MKLISSQPLEPGKTRITLDLSDESAAILASVADPGETIDRLLKTYWARGKEMREYNERIRAGKARNMAIEEIEEREREKE